MSFPAGSDEPDAKHFMLHFELKIMPFVRKSTIYHFLCHSWNSELDSYAKQRFCRNCYNLVKYRVILQNFMGNCVLKVILSCIKIRWIIIIQLFYLLFYFK